MFFEGSEKKIEIVTSPEWISLRTLGRSFWAQMVARARADILAILSNEHCDAYLLSESSLFVWHDRFLMLTCGTTTLVDAALYFFEQTPLEHIRCARFQRKNEYQPHLQMTSFMDDVDRLSQRVPGCAFRLGYPDGHHSFVFHLDKPYGPALDDTTSELLMYHIRGENADSLRCEHQTIKDIRRLLKLNRLFPDFALSDWLFTPCGYSLNAIRGNRYATIHITPHKNSSYVSFATNLDLANSPIVTILLKQLNPGCWDLIGFNARRPEELLAENTPYQCLATGEIQLSCGYRMSFNHFQHPNHRNVAAEKLSPEKRPAVNAW
ncbi:MULTISPECIES: adenosylmethionine decarboxylase [unclassified Endozoicomonas]|uniref:adenosylmethionine decarboxylase n=1 Tax=unclassified Endozoicomonas TaxID=2644528 RepID=UPI003BB634A2